MIYFHVYLAFHLNFLFDQLPGTSTTALTTPVVISDASMSDDQDLPGIQI
jgi:hypothetical protein